MFWKPWKPPQEFVRTCKREYAKLLLLLQGYALISTGVRIICTHQVRVEGVLLSAGAGGACSCGARLCGGGRKTAGMGAVSPSSRSVRPG